MSTVKSKNLQIGTDGTASNNFTIYQPGTPDGTLRIGVGNADSPTEVGQFNANGYVATKAPAFHAYPSATTSASQGTWTKVPINTERFDLTSDFDTSTYRFTPSVEGYYSVTGMVSFGENIASVEAGLAFNGSISYSGTSNWSNNVNSMTTALIYFNGSTDYVELYAIQWSGVTKTIQNNSGNVRFEAHLVRAV